MNAPDPTGATVDGHWTPAREGDTPGAVIPDDDLAQDPQAAGQGHTILDDGTVVLRRRTPEGRERYLTEKMHQWMAEARRLRDEVATLTAERDAATTALADLKTQRILSVVFGHHKGAPRPFALRRREDVSGVSGTGVVALGAEWPDGLVVLRWTSDWPTSVVFHDRGIESVEAIHGHGGKTQVVWLSDEIADLAEMEQERDQARAELAERTRERDALLTDLDVATDQRAAEAYRADQAEAERDAMRPVVEAAIAWHAIQHRQAQHGDGEIEDALIFAVERYQHPAVTVSADAPASPLATGGFVEPGTLFGINVRDAPETYAAAPPAMPVGQDFARVPGCTCPWSNGYLRKPWTTHQPGCTASPPSTSGPAQQPDAGAEGTDTAQGRTGAMEVGPCTVDAPQIGDGPPVWCRLAHGHVGDHVSNNGARWRVPSPDLNSTTASPSPGHEAGTGALEAGVAAALAVYADHGLDEDEQTDVELAAGDAVRAAAPLIEREALERAAREAADSDWSWLRIDAAHWLRTRASLVGSQDKTGGDRG